MPLTGVTIDTVSPRGGIVGTVITIDGSGFGPPNGQVIFDPLGLAIAAAITSWSDIQVVITVPAGLPANRTVIMQVVRQDGTDFGAVPFWLPATFPPHLNDGLDYQYPAFEEGTPDENADNPRKVQAADINRLLDRVNHAIATSSGDMLKATYDPDNNGIVEKSEALDDGGVPRTYADIVAFVNAAIAAAIAGGAGVVTRFYTVGVTLGDAVYQKADGTVDKASATSLGTAPAIGFIAAMDTPMVGQALVKFAGDGALFSGLVPGRTYILSKDPGKIVWESDTLNPFYPNAPGNIVQEVGVAVNAGTLLIGTTRDFEEL